MKYHGATITEHPDGGYTVKGWGEGWYHTLEQAKDAVDGGNVYMTAATPAVV
jgi:hypothetical protein